MKRSMKAICCLTALFTGMTFFGCGSESDLDGGKSSKEKAWVSFSISLPKTVGTKAADASDTNADAVETEVKTVEVWLQNAGTSTGYTKIASLNKAAFPGTGSTYTAQAVEVDGAAGDANRNLFVAINVAGDMNAVLANNTYKMGNLSEIQRLYSTTEGFVMFNSAEVKAKLYATDTEANTAANHTVVSVERTVGKAMLSYNESTLFLTGDHEDASRGGFFKTNTLKWQVRNANNKFYLIKDAAYEDPNYTFTAGGNDFLSHYEAAPYSTDWMAVPANNVAPTTGYSNDVAFVQYFPENTNEVYVEGNTTHLSVQVAFAPKQLVTNHTTPNATTPNTNLVTFYYNKAVQKYYNETAYNDAIAANPNAADDFWGPYTDGICYYYVPVGIDDLSAATMLGAKRNYFYKMKINSMTAPGNPNPGTVDPEIDPENPVLKDKVWIAVEIKVEDWTIEEAVVELK